MPTHTSQQNLYIQRINAVINCVYENLEGDLSLDALAEVAGFSSFHFHRIFRAITGETLLDLVSRLRLARAVVLLRSSPAVSISEAAYASGFKSVAVFSRGFKRQFGLNASQWDRHSPLKDSKNHQFPELYQRYTVDTLMDFETQEEFTVRLEDLPSQRLAYIRLFDSFRDFERVKAAYYRLLEWFRDRGGELSDATLYGMMQDDPDVTPLEKCRFDWCLSVPGDWQPEGEVAVRDFPACQVATIAYLGDVSLEEKIIQYLYFYWLPRSQYQPANLPAMEIYQRQPAELGWETYDIKCAIPVIPL